MKELDQAKSWTYMEAPIWVLAHDHFSFEIGLIFKPKPMI